LNCAAYEIFELAILSLVILFQDFKERKMKKIGGDLSQVKQGILVFCRKPKRKFLSLNRGGRIVNRLIQLLITTIVIIIVIAPSAGATDTPPRPMRVDDYFRFRDVGDPQISPDGKWVAYTISATDLEKDSSETRIWMSPIDGGDAVPMTAKGKSASRPRWSLDGRYLAFLSAAKEGKIQVWTLFHKGGDSQQLTDILQGVRAYEWSPDSGRMVLVLKDPRPEDVEAKKSGKEKKKTRPPWVIDRLQFKADYVGYLDRLRTHLYVFDVKSKTTTQITSGDYDDTEPVWSPDGKKIAFTSNRTAEPDRNYNTDIWVAAADNPDKGRTLIQVTSDPGPDEAPAWSPDGSMIVHSSAPDTAAMLYATRHLAVTPAGGGSSRILTRELDRNIFSPRFSADGRSILFVLEDSAESRLVRIPSKGGDPEVLIGGENSVARYTKGPKGLIAALVSRPQLPAQVFIMEGDNLRQLTHTNAELLADLQLGEVENVQFRSGDGTAIEGFIVKPPGFDSSFRYPVVLKIHGGPQSQYDHSFSFEGQLFAAAGYVVVMPNPRGSTGYGQDFCKAIWQDLEGIDYEDVMAAVDDVIARGYGDSDRLGVCGWSYGGELTNHVITRTDRFKGACTGASTFIYVSNYGHDQYQRWWEIELGLPWENREMWEEMEPFNRVENITTPTLILCGEKDWNVPVINSEQLYMALKRLGRITELVVYPGEFHGIGTPSYIKDKYTRYLDWFAKYVKGKETEAEK
jgi:dipeptidyl aminopeptidase/acylaminoacyl peptidase